MQATQPTVEFAGSAEEKKLAEEVFTLARSHGRFFPANAPVRLPRAAVLQYLVSQRKGAAAKPETVGKHLDAMIAKNGAIFAREETAAGEVTFVTTKEGTPPTTVQADARHTLVRRFMDPIPLPVREVVSEATTAPLIAGGWSQRPVFADLQDDDVEVADEQAAETVAATAPAAPATAEPAALEVPTTVATTPAVAPAAVVAPPAITDFQQVPAADLQAALAGQLAQDSRFVSFGALYFAEDQVDRYSRGDLRRIREYIVEMDEPQTDEQLLQELFNRQTNDPAYAAARFSINYRLSREKREFEFVGSADSRLWSTTGLAPLGTTLRKASELGTDYRYLLDEESAGEQPQMVEHTLTFFEWVYGLLPLDGTLREFFPTAYLDDQKTATIRFEVPQLYATFLAELRYPTANRGGYLVGFDEFYHEHVIPGTVLTLERTANNNGQFVLRFTAAPEREERLLQIDERRSRYVFRAVPVAQVVNDPWLLTETRYPRLNNVKPLDERERRRVDTVIGAAFERVAENVGTKAAPRYWSAPDELLPIVNLERPFSLRSLTEALESPQYSQFEADPDTPGTFFYTPPAKETSGGSKKRSARNQADDLDEDEEF